MGHTDVGTGASIDFGTSNWTGHIENISWGGITRGSIPTSHLLTTGGRTFIVGDLYDPGDLTLDIQYDPDDRPPFSAVEETITITYPVPTGLSNGADHAATGFIINFPPGQLGVDEKMMSTVTIKLSGDITFNPSS